MKTILVLLTAEFTLLLGQGCTPFTAVPYGNAGSNGTTGSNSSIWNQVSAAIDPTKLPLGDQKYVTDGPKKGYIFACDAKMFQQIDGPGASKVGEWINKANGTYDVTKKVSFQGDIFFSKADFSVTIAGDSRVVKSNGLPYQVPTGKFPVSTSDPAYQYDKNPNQITEQNICFSIAAKPTVASTASCIYKEVGITLDGVPLHGPLSSDGNTELAYEIQDLCTGGPQPGGGYHRHALSDCTPHIKENNALVGYALDGFGIYSPFDDQGKEYSTGDLDECHGITSDIMWEGKKVNMYHYVLTRDYPYTVACFKGMPTRNAYPPLPGAPPQISGWSSSSASSCAANPTPTPTPTPTGIDTSCSVFASDNSPDALAHVASESAANCKNDLMMLNQLYSQFQGKTCDQMKQIFASLPPPPGLQSLPPPPIPNGTIYNAIVTCSKM